MDPTEKDRHAGYEIPVVLAFHKGYDDDGTERHWFDVEGETSLARYADRSDCRIAAAARVRMRGLKPDEKLVIRFPRRAEAVPGELVPA